MENKRDVGVGIGHFDTQTPTEDTELCTCNYQDIQRLEKENAELIAEIECEERRFCGLIDQFSDVVKERDELRAQLARLVANIFSSKSVQRSVLVALSKTASLDAEMLQCVEEQAESFGGSMFNDNCYRTVEAVRARNEMK